MNNLHESHADQEACRRSITTQRIESLFASLILCSCGLLLMWMGTDILLVLALESPLPAMSWVVTITGALMWSMGAALTFLGTLIVLGDSDTD